MDRVKKKSLKDCIVSINIQPAFCRLKSLTTLYKAKKQNVFKVELEIEAEFGKIYDDFEWSFPLGWYGEGGPILLEFVIGGLS